MDATNALRAVRRTAAAFWAGWRIRPERPVPLNPRAGSRWMKWKTWTPPSPIARQAKTTNRRETARRAGGGG